MGVKGKGYATLTNINGGEAGGRKGDNLILNPLHGLGRAMERGLGFRACNAFTVLILELGYTSSA